MLNDLDLVAEFVNRTPATVRRWIRRDGLPAYKVNGRYLIHDVELVQWLLDHTAA